ncbi:hypothetical protein [Allorhizocola rhizosphaerae]|uniref:hypothetical protein n=1 Tax=Allorhizocola rhizosphaerae TaxID=1872709 RepID=UPI000E3B7D28|nr:hypothetical protein [Allorhizocola rhizosphaerae]
MSTPIRVLDTGALLGYAQQTDSHVAYQLAYCADQDLTMQTSVLCVAEAYRDSDPDAADLLDVLLGLPTIEVVECRVQDGDMVGAVAKKVDRLSLAHSCLLVYALDVPLMTTDPATALRVLDKGMVWELKPN